MDLTTERLLLRPIDEGDAPNVLLLNSDPEVLRHVHDAPFVDLEAARRWIARVKEELPHGYGRWSITAHDGTWIGRCSLRRQAEGITLMGYRLLRIHWGKGYATEAAGALLRLAFGTYDQPYVESRVARANIASQRVMRKNGGYFLKAGAVENVHEALIYRFDRSAR